MVFRWVNLRPYTEVMLVKSGELCVARRPSDRTMGDRPLKLSTVGPGELVGEYAALSGQPQPSAGRRCKLDPSLKATCFQPLTPESAYSAFNLNLVV